MRNTDYVVVSTTVDGKSAAIKLAQRIIKQKLAACVQFMPINSIYQWKGKVESAKEYLVLSKTKGSLAKKLTAFIKKQHSYEVPEIVVSPIVGGYNEYLKWIGEETMIDE